jgi:hypothetical protein
MRNWKYAAAAIGAILAVGAWSAPGKAETGLWNGPVEQNGKCWHNNGPQGLGYWSECAKPAAAKLPAKPAGKGHHS